MPKGRQEKFTRNKDSIDKSVTLIRKGSSYDKDAKAREKYLREGDSPARKALYPTLSQKDHAKIRKDVATSSTSFVAKAKAKTRKK